ncbi:hypothetical protein NKH48_03200 [Mesorhizobium sp. M1233]|uniref:hypothetical protein n=1 Tax=Mesorhizobium sp. M1233 TaxID=2957072 RepID=UPI003337E1A5
MADKVPQPPRLTGDNGKDIIAIIDWLTAFAMSQNVVNVDNTNVAPTTTQIVAAGALLATAVVDEDNMASNSDTMVPTQQSVKAYADAMAGIDAISGIIQTPADGTYLLVVKVPFGLTIVETVTKSVSGTCTAAFKIDGVALGGTANSVSSVEDAQAQATANVAAAGTDISVTISANAVCAGMSFTIKYSRVPA